MTPPQSPEVPGISFFAADYSHDGKYHVLLAATGSVATIKLPLIAKLLTKKGGLSTRLSIRILLSQSATNFLQAQSAEQPSLSALGAIAGVDGIYLDQDEWAKPWIRNDAILHIELRRWAHVLVIAPLSANSLAKIANGLSDNLLLSVVRAWDTTGLIDPGGNEVGRCTTEPGVKGEDPSRKRIFVAPAMNTAMWKHPITRKHIQILEDDFGAWMTVLKPVAKELACGDVGDGAMMDWQAIVHHTQGYLGLPSSVD